MNYPSLLAAYLVFGLVGATLAQAPLPTERIRGEVVSLDGLQLHVKSRSGDMLAVKLAENYVVTAVVKADMTSIKPGAFVGTASMPQPDGTFVALEVLVFPEAMRGAGEGHYAWDLKPGSMMTNATITAVAPGRPGGGARDDAQVQGWGKDDHRSRTMHRS